MNKSAIILLIYALLILVGGIIGHIQANSLPSLIMGLIFGTLLFGTALALFQKKEGAKGWSGWVALTLVLVLDGFFTYRFAVTQKFMPPGLLSLISTLVLLLLAWQFRSAGLRSARR